MRRPLIQSMIATGNETQAALSDVIKRIEALERRVSELKKPYTSLLTNGIRLSAIVSMLSIDLDRRFASKNYQCVYMDSEGFAKAFTSQRL